MRKHTNPTPFEQKRPRMRRTRKVVRVAKGALLVVGAVTVYNAVKPDPQTES